MQFCVSFIALWSKKEVLKSLQSCQYSNQFMFLFSTLDTNLVEWQKKSFLKCKRQRWEFCKEFTAWHFATMCADVTFVYPWKCIHFSESRNNNYVGSATCPECLTKDWRCPSCWLHSPVSGPEVDQHQVTPCLGVLPAELSKVAESREVLWWDVALLRS